MNCTTYTTIKHFPAKQGTQIKQNIRNNGNE